MKYNLLNGSNLSYIGDAYYELEIRKYLLNKNITKNKDLRDAISKDVKFHNIGRPVGSKNPYYILKFNYKISSISPDVIHIHTSSMIRYFIGTGWRKKMCVTKHDVHEDKRFFNKLFQ